MSKGIPKDHKGLVLVGEEEEKVIFLNSLWELYERTKAVKKTIEDIEFDLGNAAEIFELMEVKKENE